MRSFASVRFKSSNSEGFGRTRKTRRGAFQAPLASFSPRILPTNTYIYIPVLEYHRIPYSERVREDAEYIPLIRAFLRSNTPRYSSKLDIGGKIWHQGKNSKSEISSSFRTTRDTNERERLHTIISREQQQQQIGSVSLRCFLRLENPLGIRLISRRDQ